MRSLYNLTLQFTLFLYLRTHKTPTAALQHAQHRHHRASGLLQLPLPHQSRVRALPRRLKRASRSLGARMGDRRLHRIPLVCSVCRLHQPRGQPAQGARVHVGGTWRHQVRHEKRLELFARTQGQIVADRAMVVRGREIGVPRLQLVNLVTLL
jgi:hypothetical protein